VKDTRPVNLNLLVFRWPIPAITSILHRISGVFIFFGIAALLYLLDLSLSSQAGFDEAATLLSGTTVKVIVWAVASGILYHLIAGIKHLIMDYGFGETIEGGRTGAILVLVISAIAIAAVGYWIW
jgi:succinate dehydrogenase / fumarate reductase cytochrome b subunit|tara:strand:- start:413 stop:787 length:375 start_codon:yes stop_codon:yes gene_type:complete